jgi:Tfp pilus assembly protein PilO
MKAKETLIVLGVAVGLIACFYLFLYKPSSTKIEGLHESIQRYKGLRDREEAVRESHSRKKSEIARLEQKIEKLEVGLLTPEDEDIFMRELRNLVMEADVFGDSVKRLREEHNGKLKYLIFNVKLRGMFENIYSFLRSVEDMEKNVWFDNIRLTRMEGEKDGMVALDLDMSVPLKMVEEESL